MNGSAAFELFVRACRPDAISSSPPASSRCSTTCRAPLHRTSSTGSRQRALQRAFLASLADLRFTGDVDAMPEGTVFFADEPILRITAPLREAQLVESRVMNLLHFQTLVASKAARSVLAAPRPAAGRFRPAPRARRRGRAAVGARVLPRRLHRHRDGARPAGAFGIPVFGTMAHSYVQAHADEIAAFERFARAHPSNAMLLIDTYDTERARAQGRRRSRRGSRRGASRSRACASTAAISRDACAARCARSSTRAACTAITIFASGNLDEYRLARAASPRGAPIDGFGIGTRMNTSADAPYLDCAYKLQEYDGQPRRKRSEGKATWPGRKQVYRRYDARGAIAGDVLALAGHRSRGEPLLEPVMRGGRQGGGAAVARGLARAGPRRTSAAARRVCARLDRSRATLTWRWRLRCARLAAEIDGRT